MLSKESSESRIISIGELTFDISSRLVIKNDHIVDLTQVELRVVHPMVNRLGLFIPSKEHELLVWGYLSGTNVLAINIANIRRKCDERMGDNWKYIRESRGNYGLFVPNDTG